MVLQEIKLEDLNYLPFQSFDNERYLHYEGYSKKASCALNYKYIILFILLFKIIQAHKYIETIKVQNFIRITGKIIS